MSITSNMRKHFFGSPAELMTMLAMAIGLICSSSVYAGAQPHMLQATNFIGNPDLLIGFGAPQNDGSLVPAVLNLDNPSAPALTIFGVHNGTTPPVIRRILRYQPSWRAVDVESTTESS